MACPVLTTWEAVVNERPPRAARGPSFKVCWCFQVSSACLLICHPEIRRGVFVSQVCFATSSKGRGVWGQQPLHSPPPATWIPSQDFGHVCLPHPCFCLSLPVSLSVSPSLPVSLSLYLSLSISPSLCLYFCLSLPVCCLFTLFFLSVPHLSVSVSLTFSLQNHFGVRTGTSFTLGTKQGPGVHRPL